MLARVREGMPANFEIRGGRELDGILGVHSRTRIPKKTHLGFYQGVLTANSAELSRVCHNNLGAVARSWEITGMMSLVATSDTRCWLSYVNDARLRSATNVRARIDRATKRVEYVTTRVIEAGEQLFISYGGAFWDEFTACTGQIPLEVVAEGLPGSKRSRRSGGS